jgi:ankyrin repeat protein
MVASQFGHEGVVKQLLGMRAAVNSTGPGGLTALDFAEINGNSSVALRLLKAGGTHGTPANQS